MAKGDYEVYVVAYVTDEGDLFMERIDAADETHAVNRVLDSKYTSIEEAQDELDNIGQSVGVVWSAYDL